jgi:peptide deformylase
VSILEIRVLGDPILRAETTPVETITDELRALARDMIETMHVANGIGLAAPQVGRSERLAVVDVEGTQLVLVNPEILETSGSGKAEEGCLSIPDVYGDIVRPSRARVRARDLDGAELEVDAGGLLARCLQHEIDHLHGRLFIDYLSVLKRRSALAKWGKEKDKYPGFIRVLAVDPASSHEHPNEEL